MSFQISPLDKVAFEHLFALKGEQLAAHNAVRVIADSKPGFPCRVSLADAEVGEELILVHYEHHTTASPFRASHAVYIRTNGPQARPESGVVPDMLRSRALSLRGFDNAGMLVAADLCSGRDLEAALEAQFSNAAVTYIHIHFAKPGCYAAQATRAI